MSIIKVHNDVTIKSDNSTYLSQRKLAELLGVSNGVLAKYIQRNFINHDTTLGINEDLVYELVVYYAHKARKPTEEAKKFLLSIGKAGIRAFNYRLANFTLEAHYKAPQTFIEALEMLIEKEKALIAEREAHEETKTILNEALIKLDESSEYFSIKRVAAFNQVSWRTYSWSALKGVGYEVKKVHDGNYGSVNAYHKDAWRTVYPDIKIPTSSVLSSVAPLTL